MAKLPESDWLALSESAKRATRVFGAERVAVETALVTAFHDGKIDTRGRCRSWFEHDTLMKLGKYTWDRANVSWQVNEFAVPGDSQSSHRDHTFSDVEVHREDLEKWINDATPDLQHGPQEPAENLPPELPQTTTIGAETKCKQWLIGLMSGNSRPDRLKPAYREDARNDFNVGTKAFDRAWGNAVAETGNATWSQPGPKS